MGNKRSPFWGQVQRATVSLLPRSTHANTVPWLGRWIWSLQHDDLEFFTNKRWRRNTLRRNTCETHCEMTMSKSSQLIPVDLRASKPSSGEGSKSGGSTVGAGPNALQLTGLAVSQSQSVPKILVRYCNKKAGMQISIYFGLICSAVYFDIQYLHS